MREILDHHPTIIDSLNKSEFMQLIQELLEEDATKKKQ